MAPASHVTHLVKLLTYVTQRNAQIYDDAVTVFHASEEEEEPLVDFITRLDDNIRCSEACYATALVYIDRITEASSDLTLNAWTVQRLFSTSLLIANQFLDDTAERTLQFARVTGVHPLTMANLKTEFLFRVQFRLHCSADEVQGYSDKLQGRYSTGEFCRLGHWDGTPKSALHHHMQMRAAAQAKISPPHARSKRAPLARPHGNHPAFQNQQGVTMVAATKSSARVQPFSGVPSVPMSPKKRTRLHSHSSKKMEVLGELATMGVESMMV